MQISSNIVSIVSEMTSDYKLIYKLINSTFFSSIEIPKNSPLNPEKSHLRAP